MDEKLWGFVSSVGGVSGSILIAVLVAHKLGFWSWLSSVVSAKTSGEVATRALNEASVSIVARQAEEIKGFQAEIKELKEELRQVKDAHKKELTALDTEQKTKIDELKKTIEGLEAQYDVIVAQFREAKRNQDPDTARMLEENTILRQRTMDLEKELSLVRFEIDQLKKLRDDYNPTSSD